jgi:hypothetical protein
VRLFRSSGRFTDGGVRQSCLQLVEQGGLPVLIRGLDKSAHEDCAQYSALAIWSLSYSVCYRFPSLPYPPIKLAFSDQVFALAPYSALFFETLFGQAGHDTHNERSRG